ncbi:MAG: universal stress protein [Pseudomonadota bacterium]
MTVVCMIANTQDEDRAAVTYAASLARRMDTSLEGICALPDASSALIYATSPYMIGVGGAAIEGVEAAQTKLKADCGAMFNAVCELAGPSGGAAFTEQVELPARAAVRAATLSSAIVFPHLAGCGGHTLSEAVERVMMDAALPVVLAPAEPIETSAALIAWDGSPQAARAVRTNADVLKAFSHIHIAQNSDDLGPQDANPAAQPKALADWLQARGLDSTIHRFSGSISKGLQEVAARTSAELVVAGAYGSSRAGEMLFGGATRGLLHAESAPALLLTH